MEDQDIVRQINHLADREHHLERQATGAPLSDEEKAEVAALEVQLDQCWDLLRQRRARRNTDQDPSLAAVRPADVVEHYQQ